MIAFTAWCHSNIVVLVETVAASPSAHSIVVARATIPVTPATAESVILDQEIFAFSSAARLSRPIDRSVSSHLLSSIPPCFVPLQNSIVILLPVLAAVLFCLLVHQHSHSDLFTHILHT